jgi:hypothetical protein
MRLPVASIFDVMAQCCRVASSLLALCLILPVGCRARHDATRPLTPHMNSAAATQPTATTPAEQHWKPIAVRMRVYPTTRFVSDSGKPVLEARIEMLDEMGDSVKASGAWQVELLTGGESRISREQRKLLYSWQVQAITLAQQQRLYDPVTRAYHFRLQMDQPANPQQAVTVSVTFTPPGGATLQASSTIESTP